jgi:hypothetical protein
MVPTLPDNKALRQLQGAIASGDVRLVDEAGQPSSFLDMLDQRCWAHLRDAQDGKVYVHELKGSRDLLASNYQELLGLDV